MRRTKWRWDWFRAEWNLRDAREDGGAPVVAAWSLSGGEKNMTFTWYRFQRQFFASELKSRPQSNSNFCRALNTRLVNAEDEVELRLIPGRVDFARPKSGEQSPSPCSAIFVRRRKGGDIHQVQSRSINTRFNLYMYIGVFWMVSKLRIKAKVHYSSIFSWTADQSIQ